MTSEESNAALARWLGWHLYEGYWYDSRETYLWYNNKSDDGKYFNPMQRIDHAWLLVEHVWLSTVDRLAFQRWFENAQLYYDSDSEAAHAISTFILKMIEQPKETTA